MIMRVCMFIQHYSLLLRSSFILPCAGGETQASTFRMMVSQRTVSGTWVLQCLLSVRRRLETMGQELVSHTYVSFERVYCRVPRSGDALIAYSVQLWLMQPDLSKHTCTTCLNRCRGKHLSVILCLTSKLAWFGTTIPNNLECVLNDCGCRGFCACMRFHTCAYDCLCACMWRCVLPPLSALGSHSVVWCPLSACSHAKDHTKNTHFFSTRQPPQSLTEQNWHKIVPALKPPVH